MSSFVPLRTLHEKTGYKPGDVLVVFGELFSRGYANGIVDEAERAGLKVIRSTVGRRDNEDRLRPLTPEELAQQTQPFINVPLEAGFDMDPCTIDGSRPVDQLAGIKLNDWETAKLDWEKIEDSRKVGVQRFTNQVAAYMRELESHIPKGANIIFAHIMAGGVPRAKVMMPAMNRVFKGTGDRHVSSERLLGSDLGKLAIVNFDEVTANTFGHLIEGSQKIRERVESEGGSVRYLAYGYHGTEVLTKGEYRWQTYTCYFQGWAKMRLERQAEDAWKKGIKATVYNCPEILTNSSSVFKGVELSLYPLMGALMKEGASSSHTKQILEKCTSLLKPEHSISEILEYTDKYLTSDLILKYMDFGKWPQHNGKEKMERMLESSDHLINMHKDTGNLITAVLSEEVFRSTGYAMYHDSWKPQAPVLWVGHDVLAKALVSGKVI